MTLNKSVLTADYAKRYYVLSRNTSAIQIIPDGYERIRIGTLLQLPEGAQVEINGEGFDDNTVRIAWEGNCYYAFLDDLQTAQTYQAGAAAG